MKKLIRILAEYLNANTTVVIENPRDYTKAGSTFLIGKETKPEQPSASEKRREGPTAGSKD